MGKIKLKNLQKKLDEMVKEVDRSSYFSVFSTFSDPIRKKLNAKLPCCVVIDRVHLIESEDISSVEFILHFHPESNNGGRYDITFPQFKWLVENLELERVAPGVYDDGRFFDKFHDYYKNNGL